MVWRRGCAGRGGEASEDVGLRVGRRGGGRGPGPRHTVTDGASVRTVLEPGSVSVTVSHVFFVIEIQICVWRMRVFFKSFQVQHDETHSFAPAETRSVSAFADSRMCNSA